MVQGKKQLNSKPKFAEVVIGDNEAKEMCESDVDKKVEFADNADLPTLLFFSPTDFTDFRRFLLIFFGGFNKKA